MDYSIEVIAEQRSLTLLAVFAEQIEAALPLTFDQAYTLRLVLEEIATNIIKYGYAPNEPGPIRVHCAYDQSDLRVVITDCGQAFDPLKLPTPTFHNDASQRPVGGLGIYLVREMADEIAYDYDPAGGWNKLVVVKRGDPTDG